MRKQIRQEPKFRQLLRPDQNARAVANISLANSECAGVNRDRQHGEPRFLSAFERRLGAFTSAHEIELIPTRAK